MVVDPTVEVVVVVVVAPETMVGTDVAEYSFSIFCMRERRRRKKKRGKKGEVRE